MGVHCSRAVEASRCLMLRRLPSPPGSGFLPLLWAAPGLCCAEAPALVGDCGKMPAVATLRPSLVGSVWGLPGKDSLPSLRLPPHPAVCPAGHHPGIQCVPHRQGHPLRGQWLRLAQVLAGLIGIHPEGGLLFCRVRVSLSAMVERRESSSSLFARSHPYWLPRLILLPPQGSVIPSLHTRTQALFVWFPRQGCSV